MPHKPSTDAIFAGRRPPAFHDYAIAGRRLHAAEAGNPRAPLVLLVHGTPGGWDDFAPLLADTGLCARACVVAVDRPGWGGSGGALETSLARQAAALSQLLDAHPENLPAIVVGHSLGAPIAARLAMDDPGRVRALVLVSGSIDPAQEKTAWYVAASRWRLLHWAVPKVLARADDEIKPLRAQLQDMVPRWSELRMPVTVLQGAADALVSPANADFAARLLTNAPVTMMRIPRQGHLIHWERPDLIRDAILAQLP